MHKQLAAIHAEFGVYPNGFFAIPDSCNIVSRLSTIPELDYLYQFYYDYRLAYESESQKFKVASSSTKVTKVSRWIDLPYVGENSVIRGRAKYFFIFEGSLQKSDHLSITVLSCLWPLENPELYKDIFKTFWQRPAAYKYIVDRLGINKNIAKNSYVTDAVRVVTKDKKSDILKNRALLEREINLLSPEHVILVGGTAKKIIGEKELSECSSQYFHVPFPTKRWPSRLEDNNKRYFELHKLLGSLTILKRKESSK
jgi:hypothetical protein